MDSASLENLILGYTAAWSEPDASKRKALLAQVWEETGQYTDPLMHAADRTSLDAGIGRFLQENPGSSFTVKGKIDHHHYHIRFSWILHFADGREVQGMDYGEISPEGKLSKIVGFF